MTTDGQGKVVFTYSLENASDFSQAASFVGEEDSTWRNIEYPHHYANRVMNEGVKKQELTLILDSLATLKVRLKKTTASPALLALGAYLGANTELTIRYTDLDAQSNRHTTHHLGWSRKDVGVFDSLFVFKVLTKANNVLTGRTDTLFTPTTGAPFFEKKELRTFELKQSEFRDSTILLSFK